MTLKAIVFLALAAAFAEDRLTVINLVHRPADSIVPILVSLYGNQAVIRGANMKILVRSSASVANEIQQLAAQLDHRTRMLRVAIRDNGQSSSSSSQIGASGNASFGPGLHAGVRSPTAAGNGVGGAAVGGGNAVNNVQIVANQSSQQSRTSGERYLLVEEGVPAALGDGSGATIVARVNGDQVNVQLVPASAPQNGATTADGASLNTMSNAPLGQWTPLGGTSNSNRRSNSGILNRGSQENNSANQFMLKVDPQ